MKHINKQFSLSFIILLTAFTFSSCKKASDDNNNTTPQKSLNKTTFAPKKWYSEGSAFVHDFKAGNVYNISGTWNWKNNSDTLIIVSQSGYSPTEWIIYWNSDHEMEGEKIGTFTKLLYKDVAW